MFEGLLPKSLNIYAVTASNATEDSYATYCPDFNNVSVTYDVCLGDRFSVSWMEDRYVCNLSLSHDISIGMKSIMRNELV